jgi:integral membrane sensor domain MASE1
VLPQLGYFVAAALLYVVLARIGLKLTIPPHDIAVFWPPNGVLLAMLLASDRRRWPAIF